MRHLITAGDLADDDVGRLLLRTREIAARSDWNPPTVQPLVGTVFTTPSMRTRVGFEVAARRLGGSSVAITELRVDGAMSASESLGDALRVVAGMVDAVVVRCDDDLRALDLTDLPAPLINGGDASQHPTQALIDLAAIEWFAGSVADVHVALVGDLRMRAATSLISLLQRRGVGRLSAIHPPGRGPVDAELERREPGAFAGIDAVIMIGLPPGRGESVLDDAGRATYALDERGLEALPEHAVVLSPMPVIDELSPAARQDPRLRMFEQSDLGVAVRTAVLEHVLAG